MDAEKGNILVMFNGGRQFIIPIYQRLYSWEKEQWKRLWDDIIKMQKNGKDNHFVGSIVSIADKISITGIQKYMIIDGQQRITTLTLILIALRDYAIKNPGESNIKPDIINDLFLTNIHQNGDDKYKLLLTEEDKQILISLIEKRPIPQDTVSKLLNSYNYFYEQIEKKEILPESVYESTSKLLIVSITLDRENDDPQAIFESLNSTGKELSASDLIRNYVLMGMKKEAQYSLYKNQWRPMELLFGHKSQEITMDWFFRDYLTMKSNKIPKIGNIYEEFKRWKINCDFKDNVSLCEDLYDYAKIYSNIVFAESSDSKLTSLYKQIKTLRMDVVIPFLLTVIHDNSLGILPYEDMIETIELCISYVLRRSICEIPTNSLNKTFATLASEIDKNDYVNSIKAIFLKKDSYRRFPDNKEFMDAFITKEIYKARNRNYVLDRLENFDNKSPVIIDKLTIEHVMPQNNNLSEEWKDELGEEWETVHDTYLHTIGNLTLTGYNSEMSDRPFFEKMTMPGGFKQTAVRLNQTIINQKTWNKNTIVVRATILAEKALSIWAYPSLSKEKVEQYISTKKKYDKVNYSLESYNLNEYTSFLFEKLDLRIMNLSSEVNKEFKKYYIAYKFETNFADIVFQSKGLRISVNMKFSAVNDPKLLCKDITDIGRWGNGDVEVYFENIDQLDDVMDIIKQSYDSQL